MTRYRKIDPRIWNDEKFIAMSHEAQRLFLFVLTHPSMTMLGAFRISQAGLAEELGLTFEAFEEAFGQVLTKGMLKYDRKAFLIWAPSFLKYNEPESPNVVKSWENVIDLLPECELKSEVLVKAHSFVSARSPAFLKALPQAFSEALPQALAKGMPNQEQEQEQEQEETLTNTLPVNEEEASEKTLVGLSPKQSVYGMLQPFGQNPINESQEVTNRSFDSDASVEFDAPIRQQIEAVQLEASGDLDDPKHILSVVDMIVVAKCNGIRLTRNVKLEEIANARTITLELFGKCISQWRGTQTGIGYFMGILSNAANDPSLFDEKPPAKKKKVSAETIADGQAWVFARKLAYYHPFGSRFARAGEEYDEFINRIAEDLKKPDRFELFRHYMVKLNLIDEENEHDNATQA